MNTVSTPRTWVLMLLIAGGLGGACQDPCVALAERICGCELSSTERRNCRNDRIENQKDDIEIDDNDRSVCTQKLDTCTCAALDQNDLDACGFEHEAAQ